MLPRIYLSAIAVCLSLLLLAPGGWAAADENTNQARALYDNGLTNYNLGHYETR